MKKTLALLALCLAPVPYAASDASACAIASASRSAVSMAGEEALIVWDARARRQHFVRTASFAGADRDFGFLVPTPTVPELAEVRADVFTQLFAIYRAPDPPARAPGVRARGIRAAPAEVQVLAQVTVAGLDASVLRATDPDALRVWLEQNHYPASEPLRDWFARYVRDGWIVTAFKIDPGAQRGRGFATRAVRMSFDAPEPFFPYSEPRASAPVAGRPFRVSVVSQQPMRVREGSSGWRGRIGYRAQPGQRLGRALREVVPDGSFSADAWLTVFDEPRSVRGSGDLFFEPDPRGRAVSPRIRTRLHVRTAGPPAGREPIVDPFAR